MAGLWDGSAVSVRSTCCRPAPFGQRVFGTHSIALGRGAGSGAWHGEKRTGRCFQLNLNVNAFTGSAGTYSTNQGLLFVVDQCYPRGKGAFRGAGRSEAGGRQVGGRSEAGFWPWRQKRQVLKISLSHIHILRLFFIYMKPVHMQF